MFNRWLFSYALLTTSFLSFPLSAECIPSPDCTELGYDQTSCPSGDGVLKCPFDISKVKCIPTNCKDITCAVGDIYYSDKTCSADLISGKTPIGVVGYVTNGGKNGIVVEKNHSSSSMQWGCYGNDLSCIPNMSGATSTPEKTDYNGKANTACMVSNGCTAGTYCNNRKIEGVTGWYLPAGGELYVTMVENQSAVNSGLEKISGAVKIFSTNVSVYYWTSSEYNDTNAWEWPYDGDYLGGKGGYSHVRCVLAF